MGRGLGAWDTMLRVSSPMAHALRARRSITVESAARLEFTFIFHITEREPKCIKGARSARIHVHVQAGWLMAESGLAHRRRRRIHMTVLVRKCPLSYRDTHHLPAFCFCLTVSIHAFITRNLAHTLSAETAVPFMRHHFRHPPSVVHCRHPPQHSTLPTLRSVSDSDLRATSIIQHLAPSHETAVACYPAARASVPSRRVEHQIHHISASRDTGPEDDAMRLAPASSRH